MFLWIFQKKYLRRVSVVG